MTDLVCPSCSGDREAQPECRDCGGRGHFELPARIYVALRKTKWGVEYVASSARNLPGGMAYVMEPQQ